MIHMLTDILKKNFEENKYILMPTTGGSGGRAYVTVHDMAI